MWSRGRLDLSWSDLLSAIVFCANPFAEPEPVEERIAAKWHGTAMSARCVRTALDLILRSVDWSPSSDVLMSAVTVPDMPRLVRIAGHRPVPLDIDADADSFSVVGVRERLSQRTSAIVVAPLFGSRFDFAALRSIADEHGLLLIEDAAQVWDGAYSGDPLADVSLFSFGPIKTATALGGAVAVVRNPELLERMRDIQHNDPREPARKLLGHSIRFGILKGLSGRFACSALQSTLQLAGRDFDQWVNDAMRGFGRALPPDASDEERRAADTRFLERLRCSLSAAQRKLLERRLNRFRVRTLQSHTRRCRRFVATLPASVKVPWRRQEDRIFWTFPVIVDRPTELAAFLNDHGYDATVRHRLASVTQAGFDTPLADRMLNGVVFLPVYPALTDRALARLGDLVTQFESQT